MNTDLTLEELDNIARDLELCPSYDAVANRLKRAISMARRTLVAEERLESAWRQGWADCKDFYNEDGDGFTISKLEYWERFQASFGKPQGPSSTQAASSCTSVPDAQP